MLSRTSCQFPCSFCRNSLASGYQGVLEPCPHIQAQSFAKRTQTGFPKAPAKCAIAVSTVITKSNPLIAAVSAKFFVLRSSCCKLIPLTYCIIGFIK